jgi:hypothetical protein
MALAGLRVAIAGLCVVPIQVIRVSVSHLLVALGIVKPSKHSKTWPFLRDLITSIFRGRRWIRLV